MTEQFAFKEGVRNRTAMNSNERFFIPQAVPVNKLSQQSLSGARFAQQQRGVDVRVMLDGVGELYSTPQARTLLKKGGVRIARFLPPRLIPPMLYNNLCNHRKILVSDGYTGFVGGIHISDRHLVNVQENSERVVDLHFRLRGPIVSQIEHVFLEDWRFTTGEKTVPSTSAEVGAGGAICRTIVDGPNEDMDKLASILLGGRSQDA